MAKLKHTKNELKAQREALARYERFLPMLQLKKQQLQMEILQIGNHLSDNATKWKQRRERLSRWIPLFSESTEIGNLLRLQTIYIDEDNIAGVPIPVFKDISLVRTEYDLFSTPTWFDDAMEEIEQLIRLDVERATLEEQKSRVEEELRITSQRVNLFEKVKIPECKENIRIIKIFLGDEQTAAVARAKLAKGKLLRTANA